MPAVRKAHRPRAGGKCVKAWPRISSCSRSPQRRDALIAHAADQEGGGRQRACAMRRTSIRRNVWARKPVRGPPLFHGVDHEA